MEFLPKEKQGTLLPEKSSERRDLEHREKDNKATSMNTTSSHAKKSGKLQVLILGIVIGFAGGWLFFEDDARSLLGVVSEEEEISWEEKEGSGASLSREGSLIPVSLVAEGENILVVSNQPEGSSVVMSMVSINVGGWISIHGGGLNNEVSGAILGARRFNAGKYFGEKVELLRDTEEGKRYFAVLHADNGDGIFDYTIEVPLQDSAGDMITGAFIATSGFSN